MAFTERYKSSAVPQMQRLLNELHNNEESAETYQKTPSASSVL